MLVKQQLQDIEVEMKRRGLYETVTLKITYK